MSTTSFTDPVYLARFGLSRVNALEYFLLPLNPFLAPSLSSNQVLSNQRINVDALFQDQIRQQQWQGRPFDPVDALKKAEDAYARHLEMLVGEQYELMPAEEKQQSTNEDGIGNQNQQQDGVGPAVPAQEQLFVIRHVLRSSRTAKKILGIYYIIEGTIFKSPSVRSIVKANLARTLQALTEACESLSSCARYHPTLGYSWDFERPASVNEDEKERVNAYRELRRSRKRARKMISADATKNTITFTETEEEALKATEAIDNILVRLSKREMNLARISQEN